MPTNSGVGSVRPSRPALVPQARRPVDPTRQGLLDAKVSIPEPAMPVLPRQRLFDVLTAAARRRVTLLNASAGSGKTMLLSSWLNCALPSRAAWVSFDRNDNEPKVFWSYVVESLRRACVEDGDPFSGLTGEDPGSERFPQTLLDAVAQLTAPVTLVLDQAHEITNWRLLTGLEVLIHHAPPTFRLVLSGRGQPALPLARLRVAGELADVGSADLACTPEETRDLLASFGIELGERDLARVWERTEGWMTGLRLAALWWGSQPAGRRDMAAFTGDEPLVADYLDDEILGAQSARTRRFLLLTPLVDRLNGDLADALTGEHDGAQTLDTLDRDNALVTSTGAHRSWYRYGPLLREFLSYRLRREMPEQIPELQRKAARWFAEQGLVVDAARSAVAARDWGLAAEILVRDGYRTFANGEGADLEPLLAMVPGDEVRGSAELAALCAHVRLGAADADGAEAFLRLAEADAPGPDREHRLLRRIRCAELRLRQSCLRGQVGPEEVALGHALLGESRDAGLAAACQADVGALAYWLGVAELWRGALPEARKVLEHALPRLAEGGLALWEGRTQAWLTLVNALEGRLDAAERALGSRPDGPPRDPEANGSPRAATEGSSGSGSLVLDLARAQVELERDRLDQAWTLLERHRQPGHVGDSADRADPPVAEMLGVFRARVLLYQGDVSAARAELAAAKDAAVRLRSQVEHAAALLEIEVLLQEGATARAEEVLTAARSSERCESVASHAVALGRVHLAAADPNAALAAVTPCLSGQTVRTRVVDTVGALLVAATAHRRLGAQAPAAEFLERALALAERDGLVRVFLDAGRGVRALLTVLIAPEGPHAGFRTALLHRFDVAPAASWKPPEQSVRLTASERAVLRYLPSHLTNEEIAQDLCLSVNTVKSHLRTLYRKLGVTSRREAIARALQLDLLR
ncbi:LuxR C-terminal-related transcriptional regulator [Actinopolymorpha pittospori]|uniref:LuxR family maltose regulon positive regulatory protein n=1 Tax=Actinopolymorpha pittospori TaxID=648752 RepID=A0A927N4L8_9ACTN|nr:LuxR C-terminal-related transcriptional regulator [Actinopolymorpha pittospori]MBE1611632.1 LuxR family maltose regulon positive regulatory protein [Actinopolymorpha pittospori]